MWRTRNQTYQGIGHVYQGVGQTYQGIGQEEYGPPMPTVTQSVTQAVTDLDQSVESWTGFKYGAYYIGVGLIGWVVYQYMVGEGE